MLSLVACSNPLGSSNEVLGDLCVPSPTDPTCSGNAGGGNQGGPNDDFVNAPLAISHAAILLTSPDTPVTNWIESPDSDIDYYELAVGSQSTGSGINNLVDWTNVGQESFHPGFTNVSGIQDCTDYYTSVRAVDTSGNISEVATTTIPFQVDANPPTQPGNLTIANTFAKTDATHTVSWDASTELCAFDQYEFAVGTTGTGSGINDVIDWVEIGDVLTFQANSPADASFTLSHGTDYFTSVRAKDSIGNISTPATTSAWQLNYDYFKATSTGTTAGSNVNQGTATSLEWSPIVFDTEHFAHDVGTPEEIEILTAGDYLVNVLLPIDATVTRSNIRLDVYLDSALVQGGRSQSSYIRNGSNHTESSDHAHLMVPGVTANQILTIRVRQVANGGTVNITDQATVVVRKVDASAKVLNALASSTTGGANVNQATNSALEWTRAGSDRYDASVYDHTSGSEDIEFLEAGDYFVMVNVPFFDPNGNQGDRTSVRGNVRLNGTSVGAFRQGYMRRANGHNESSIHWAGVVRGVSAADVLTVTLTRDSSVTDTVNLDSGQSASIYIEQIENDRRLDVSGSTINNLFPAQTNWNQVGRVEWTTQDIIDNALFGHDPMTNPESITLLQDGDYYVSYADDLGGGVQRANPVIELSINGAIEPGIACKSHYIRNSNSHVNASCSFVTLLEDLSAGDVIAINTRSEAATGSITATTPARMLIWKRP